MRKIVFCFIAYAFLASSCNSGSNNLNDQVATVSEASLKTEANPTASSTDQALSSVELPEPGSKVIKTGDISFETGNLCELRKKTDTFIKKNKAYISQDNEFSFPDRIEQRLNIRVPSEHFDQLITDITEGIDRFDNKSISINDITEEFIDLGARLKTKKEVEERYRQILSRANTIQEILSVEGQIGSIRAEIESCEGRLKYLQSQTSYSTLNLVIYEKISSPIGFSSKFGRAFVNGWHNLVWLFIGLINIWPFIMAIIILLFLLRTILRKKKKRKNNPLI